MRRGRAPLYLELPHCPGDWLPGLQLWTLLARPEQVALDLTGLWVTLASPNTLEMVVTWSQNGPLRCPAMSVQSELSPGG